MRFCILLPLIAASCNHDALKAPDMHVPVTCVNSPPVNLGVGYHPQIAATKAAYGVGYQSDVVGENSLGFVAVDKSGATRGRPALFGKSTAHDWPGISPYGEHGFVVHASSSPDYRFHNYFVVDEAGHEAGRSGSIHNMNFSRTAGTPSGAHAVWVAQGPLAEPAWCGPTSVIHVSKLEPDGKILTDQLVPCTPPNGVDLDGFAFAANDESDLIGFIDMGKTQGAHVLFTRSGQSQKSTLYDLVPSLPFGNFTIVLSKLGNVGSNYYAIVNEWSQDDMIPSPTTTRLYTIDGQTGKPGKAIDVPRVSDITWNGNGYTTVHYDSFGSGATTVYTLSAEGTVIASVVVSHEAWYPLTGPGIAALSEHDAGIVVSKTGNNGDMEMVFFGVHCE